MLSCVFRKHVALLGLDAFDTPSALIVLQYASVEQRGTMAHERSSTRLLLPFISVYCLTAATGGFCASCTFYANVDPAKSPLTYSGRAADNALVPLYTAAGGKSV